MHSHELAITLLLTLAGCETGLDTAQITNERPAAELRAGAVHEASATSLPVATAPMAPAPVVPAPAVEVARPIEAVRAAELAPRAGVRRLPRPRATPIAAALPSAPETCRARVCPRWTGAAEVNTAARVRPRGTP